jgi:hypothetical protein
MSRIDTITVLLTHEPPDCVERMLAFWRSLVAGTDLLVIYGGSRADFSKLPPGSAAFCDDPELRFKTTPQLDRQSYAGVFRVASQTMAGRPYRYVWVMEFDHVPLDPGVIGKLKAHLMAEDADMVCHRLRRNDRTNAPHYLFHRSDPGFTRFWTRVSRRRDPEVVLSMLGTGSFWQREAFDAAARVDPPGKIYLELYLPTLAHHLGFRVRGLPGQDGFVTPYPLAPDALEQAVTANAWTIHPIKAFWRDPAPPERLLQRVRHNL